jgi:hypothetical protein
MTYFSVRCPNGCEHAGLTLIGYHPLRGRICRLCGHQVVISD